jgi:hypothetical protein
MGHGHRLLSVQKKVNMLHQGLHGGHTDIHEAKPVPVITPLIVKSNAGGFPSEPKRVAIDRKALCSYDP